MYLILWEYVVKAGQEAGFEKIYGPNGDWVQLFKQAEGYLGTELLQDIEVARRYVTIDRWASSAAYDSFRAKYQVEYEAIDARCGFLTQSETCMGAANFPT